MTELNHQISVDSSTYSPHNLNTNVSTSPTIRTATPTTNTPTTPTNSYYNMLYNGINSAVDTMYKSDFGSNAMNQFFNGILGIRSTNPISYGWGRSFEDTLNMLFDSPYSGKMGNPPASDNAIDALPIIVIQESFILELESNESKNESLSNLKKSKEEGVCKSLPTRDCTICMQDFIVEEKATLLPCDHLFHLDCVKTWLQLHNQCPVCRFEVESQCAYHNQKKNLTSSNENSLTKSQTQTTPTQTQEETQNESETQTESQM